MKKIIWIIFAVIFCASLGANIWMSYQLRTTLDAYNSQVSNTKVLDFAKMFVKDVLMASKDVDFDTRLSLETTVRALNDQDIFSQWQRFTKAGTKEDASTEAKILLDLLIEKIRQ